MIRYRFGDFILSPQRRLLLREGQEVPLIPRYFDLLLLLVERRREAVHRREIFERVWGDVNVSDSALSQAVRTIRSTLKDDSREPRFIRTVSRHGYQFVFPDVIEESDEGHATALPTPVETPPIDSLASGWSRASGGGALAGIVSGSVGGLILALAPDSTAPIALAPVLAVIGGACGALGGAGIGAGLAFAETRAYSPRAIALPIATAIGGGAVGFAVQWLSRWALAALVGLDINIGGGLEGVVIGAAAGLGFAIATRRTPDGSEEPRLGQRLQAAFVIALICGIAGLAVTFTGRPLAGGTIHKIARAADGSRATLTPLGRLIGEPDFGPVTSATLAFGEAATFGLGLALGVIRRSR